MFGGVRKGCEKDAKRGFMREKGGRKGGARGGVFTRKGGAKTGFFAQKGSENLLGPKRRHGLYPTDQVRQHGRMMGQIVFTLGTRSKMARKGFFFTKSGCATLHVVFNTRALHGPLAWTGHRCKMIFYTAGGMPHCDARMRQTIAEKVFTLPY